MVLGYMQLLGHSVGGMGDILQGVCYVSVDVGGHGFGD